MDDRPVDAGGDRGRIHRGEAARPPDSVPRDGAGRNQKCRARRGRHGRAWVVPDGGELPPDGRARDVPDPDARQRGGHHPQGTVAADAVDGDDGWGWAGHLRAACDGRRAGRQDRDGLGLRRQRGAPARVQRRRAPVLRPLRDVADGGHYQRDAGSRTGGLARRRGGIGRAGQAGRPC